MFENVNACCNAKKNILFQKWSKMKQSKIVPFWKNFVYLQSRTTSATWQWGSIYGLGVYLTLCSWRIEILQPSSQSKSMATVDVHGCVFTRQRYTLLYKVYQRCDIHTGVGFCVASSTWLGNAKVSMRGTGDGKNPTLFFVNIPINLMRTIAGSGNRLANI